jgi:tRNA(His) 5'-end guanylyltransferase
MIETLKQRISSYEEVSDTKLLKRLPIILILNGRNFKKVTQGLNKPVSAEFIDVMCNTTLKIVHAIDGVIFAYAFNDEVVLVLRNDQSNVTEAWYNNHIQDMVSAASSIATIEFIKSSANMIKLSADPVFLAKAFNVPNITEAINLLVFKQQQAHYHTVTHACVYELAKRFDSNYIEELLYNRDVSDKIEILKEECDIDYEDYPVAYKRGIACYRGSSVFHDQEAIRAKWITDTQLPVFTKDQTFLNNILKVGRDIIRANRDI